MSTFHPFSRLPTELRLHIWALAVEPRIVELRVVPDDSSQVQRLVSLTPAPAIVQTCQESRNLGLYKQAFSEVTATKVNVAAGAESRYVWLNLDIDMVSIGKTSFEVFKPVALSIKRLRFERENSDEYFFHVEVRELWDWTNTEEIHVVCADGMESWHKASEEHFWPCPLENLWFFDPDDGRMMRSIEMEKMLDEQQEESWRRHEGAFENDDDD
ncbi:uncharacterized protein GGS22DRAFT_195566 [Annulohypoxylon maeteangense]|uniref:uncharacterized protein n=1 Tax=Annulohypoxylon maeteangense TaxID=1927788 RepID=UPI002008214F|nr:uncharacterized protein GGS22DRAFT_195566 [Annulohypoxylon maeteangense]KAI0882845.1 hypothetical protein GGS22DRAFT_195566 [Annulohypoxylon maeteangense]